MSVDKSSVLKKLRESDAIYVLMSDCTRMRFVLCYPETYDDEVFIFFSEEDAMRGGQEFLNRNLFFCSFTDYHTVHPDWE